MKTTNHQTVLLKSDVDNIPLPKPKNLLCLEDSFRTTTEGSLWVSIKMHRIWTEAQLYHLLPRWPWAVTLTLNLDFLKQECWVSWSCFPERGNKGKSLPLENENFKSRHNTKGREMPKAPRLASRSCGFSNCAMTPLEAWHQSEQETWKCRQGVSPSGDSRISHPG